MSLGRCLHQSPSSALLTFPYTPHANYLFTGEEAKMSWMEIQEGRLCGYGVIDVLDRQLDHSMAGAVRRGNELLLQKWGSRLMSF